MSIRSRCSRENWVFGEVRLQFPHIHGPLQILLQGCQAHLHIIELKSISDNGVLFSY